MEDVLDVYKRPLDPDYPVICVDETFKQLIGETRQRLPAKPAAVERYDHVYTRNGVASLFLAFEPLRSWRTIWVTDRRRRFSAPHCRTRAPVQNLAQSEIWETSAWLWMDSWLRFSRTLQR